MPMPDRDKDVEKLLRVLEKPAAQARLRELLGPPSSTLPASGEGMREVYLRERGWVTYDGEGWLYLNGGERHTLQQAFDREWTRLRPATVVSQDNRWQANPVRPDRATRLSRALAEMHEAHRRVKKANRTQAQTISKLQAELAAANSNRDGAIQNASDYFNRIIRPGDVIAISMCGASSYHRYRVYGINGLTLKLEALPDDA